MMKLVIPIILLLLFTFSCEKEEPHLLTFDCWYTYEGGWGGGEPPQHGGVEPPAYYVLHVEVTMTEKGTLHLYVPDQIDFDEVSDDNGVFGGHYWDCGDTSVTVTLPNGESAVHGAYHDNH